ncbi:MAG: sigma-70 family RNA polymerase sigma factor [Planctomycetaceae bacterium]|nr:sigma-70 family RNA polymerase sigma factor [Planctomycetaceae bacterium]
MDTGSSCHVEQLLARARGGASDCLGRLFQYYGNYLKLLVATHIDERLHARCSPSDVVQETYCDAHRDFAKFRGNTEGEFVAWLKAILVNNMAREVEKHILAAKRDVRREVRLDGMREAMDRSAARLEEALADSGPSPSSDVHHREHTIMLANCLADLPPDYRRVLMLRHCEGLPFQEIGQRMGRSPGAARMLWLRAIGRIRERQIAGGTS